MIYGVTGHTVLVSCSLSLSAFSAERVFSLNLAEHGGLEYSGVAPLHYCLDAERRPIPRGEPVAMPLGNSIPGYVEAFLIEADTGAGTARVEFPNGEAVTITLGLVPGLESILGALR